MKLTKTQAKLMEAAANHGGGYSVETMGGRGPQGGRVGYGRRDADALFALEKAGKVRITHRSTWVDYNRGYSQRGTVLRFEVLA